MQAIAKKEIEANTLRLIDRNYLWGGCDPVTNAWNFESAVGAPQRIYYDGKVQRVAMIDKADIDQVLNAPEPVHVDEPPAQMEQDHDGANQGMLTQVHHGRRLTERIKIDAFTINLKLWQARIPNEFNSTSHGMPNDVPNNPNYLGNVTWHQWFLRGADGAFTRQMPETVVIRYGIYQVFNKAHGDAILDLDHAEDPEADQLIPMRRWGYSSALDLADADKTKLIKKRCIFSDQITLNLRESLNKEKSIRKYIKMKKPLTVTWLPQDQNGVQQVSSRFYFCIRSNIPQVTGLQTVDYAPFAPLTAVCFKTHYHE